MTAPENTLKAHIQWASNTLQTQSDSPQLDAEVLLCHVLQKPRSHLMAWPERALNDEQHQRFTHLVAQRRAGHPVAHLTGEREFWSLTLRVTPDVLVPRADTELLVELALAHIQPLPAPSLLDLGTGSGAIAIAIASERPDATVYACDLSPAALTVARENAERHHCRNVHCYLGSWFEALPDATAPFDLIVSNPPYIADDDPHLQQGDLPREPHSALVAAQSGMADLQWISEQARQYLQANGALMMEHGWQQGAAVRQALTQQGYEGVRSESDLGGNERVTLGRSPGPIFT